MLSRKLYIYIYTWRNKIEGEKLALIKMKNGII